MCIRDRGDRAEAAETDDPAHRLLQSPQRRAADDRHGARACLLYTSDAADDLLCVDLGGRRIIKKK